MKAQDKIYEAYFNSMGEDFGQKVRERIHWICENVEGEKVLDIGCSQGIADVLLAREGKKVLGIDVLQESIEFAYEKLDNEAEYVRDNVKFVQASFLEYDLEDEKYHTIIMTEVLEHLLQPKLFIEKALEHLAGNGRLIVTVPFGINDYFDHKKTYYCKEILDLLQDKVNINEVSCMGKWIGFICTYTNEQGKLDFADILDKIEKNFYQIERELVTLCDTRKTSIINHQKIITDYKIKQEENNSKINILEKNTQTLERTIEQSKKEKELLIADNKNLEQEKEKQLQEIIELNKIHQEKENKILEYKYSEELLKQALSEQKIKEERMIEALSEEKERAELLDQIKVLNDRMKEKLGLHQDIEEILQEETKQLTEERDLLVAKVMEYLKYIEQLIDEQDALNEKRNYLLERTDTLYTNNQSLVEELKRFKERYKALSSSKLGKLTLLLWKIKKKIRMKVKRG